jgi:hypothetical protein
MDSKSSTCQAISSAGRPNRKDSVFVKSLVTAVATRVVIGIATAASMAVTSIASVASVASVAGLGPAAPPIHAVVFDAPLPLDPAADVPTNDQLLGLLNALVDPGVPFASKSYLVEGGISPVEARVADGRMKKAVGRGEVPLTLSVANIRPAGPTSATADVSLSGPKLAPTQRTLTFVDQGGWKVTHNSAMAMLQEAGGGGG